MCLGVQRGLGRVLIKYSGNVRLQLLIFGDLLLVTSRGGPEINLLLLCYKVGNFQLSKIAARTKKVIQAKYCPI